MTPRKKKKVEAKESMLLLCATEAEAAFFSQMRKDCRYSNLTVELTNAKTLDKAIADAGSRKMKGRYSSAWCLFGLEDYSVVPNDVAGYEEIAEKRRVRLCYFDPSFDLYFALFEMTPRKRMTKEDLERRCKASFDGFELTKKYFLTSGLNLNFRIYPQLAVADQNARSYNDLIELDEGVKATSLPDFLNDLKEVCGKADMSHARNRF